MWVCVLGGGGCFKWPQSAPFEHVWHSLSPLVLMLTGHSSWPCASAQRTWGNLLRVSTSHRREEAHHPRRSSQPLLWTFNIPAVLTFNKGRKNLLDPAAVCQVKGALLWRSTAVRSDIISGYKHFKCPNLSLGQYWCKWWGKSFSN